MRLPRLQISLGKLLFAARRLETRVELGFRRAHEIDLTTCRTALNNSAGSSDLLATPMALCKSKN
jgi:hypothetical protein